MLQEQWGACADCYVARARAVDDQTRQRLTVFVQRLRRIRYLENATIILAIESNQPSDVPYLYDEMLRGRYSHFHLHKELDGERPGIVMTPQKRVEYAEAMRNRLAMGSMSYCKDFVTGGPTLDAASVAEAKTAFVRQMRRAVYCTDIPGTPYGKKRTTWSACVDSRGKITKENDDLLVAAVTGTWLIREIDARSSRGRVPERLLVH